MSLKKKTATATKTPASAPAPTPSPTPGTIKPGTLVEFHTVDPRTGRHRNGLGILVGAELGADKVTRTRVLVLNGDSVLVDDDELAKV